ncbi:bifunctional UDP-N-acetylmuramoyl-L-alanyl-D-glutamate--2,6-diaminopimelate ligase MurE/UDP-N-acetylmuramoyl-tripeptide--D-alanyl-D-alanine ligase MurF [Castellaniella sp.]|uniref:bifunctional UDP-N-acetylmuramoyl-L-alanyl-D-glutamate--2, 6-diaminopimelate ligase MurE/UDP-N-acetylmuramoyl-tripeptide--D-alanyl-D-alanine ligase MurF n=1 Tax=Castellaniella sp. TaxID=1955812 RepID=UPI0035609DF3
MSSLDILTWLDEQVARTADLCLDSRQVQAGDVFFACPGLLADGRGFMQAAVYAGAGAIVRTRGGEFPSPEGVPVLEVDDLARHLGEIAHLWYGRPSDALTVIAVTGTNGKTSTTQWIAAALNAEDMPCGTVGTLGVTLADGRNLGGMLTTPDVLTLHRSLAAIHRAGAVAAAIEASSIGIEQGRLDGVTIQVAGFTNLTRDHLDYHGSLDAYKKAKFALFDRPGLRGAIINADDPAGRELLAHQPASGHRHGYGLMAGESALFRAEDIQHSADGLVFNLLLPRGRAQIVTHLVGEHNISNLLLVAGVLRELGWGLSRTARALARLQPVPGRLQAVAALPGGATQGPHGHALVVVDYAHTPDALERVLVSLRPMTQERKGQLWCVFGCGGDRDAGKRPMMGAVAERLADRIVVTSDNPRNEPPQAIAQAILSGMTKPVHVQLDRARAILETLWGAAPRDVILLAGKGHETWQEIRGVRRPFDDRDWACLALTWQQGAHLATDTRDFPAGALFPALRGERHDGHDFVQAAARAGARAALVEHRVPDVDLPQLVLGDMRHALRLWASVWRRQFHLPVIAVTGSNGKTTTKEMISTILAVWWGADQRLATPGNFNNDIGVPLSVLRLHAGHRAAVFELGMNHPGEIAELAAIAQPTVALVNNAQREHQEFMLSVEAVARENGQVLCALPEDGIAVFPAEDAYESVWRGLAASRRVRCFGFSDRAEVRAARIRARPQRTEFELQLAGQSHDVVLRAPGRHNLHNALAAATCAWAAGAPVAAIVEGLQQFVPVGGRMQPSTMADGFQLIDDTYNANPDSVRAAIEVLAALDGRRILVLGDMGEVGLQGPAMHAEVGAHARDCGIDVLLTLGPASRGAAEAFGSAARSFDSLEALLPQLLAARPGHILVKGSRSMQMERVVHALQADMASQSGGHHAS